MPETPDFEQLARTIICGVDAKVIQGVIEDDHGALVTTVVAQVEAQLRFLWNARGAADLAELDAALAGGSPSMKVIDQILRALDR